jgi:hypothetical protein
LVEKGLRKKLKKKTGGRKVRTKKVESFEGIPFADVLFGL